MLGGGGRPRRVLDHLKDSGDLILIINTCGIKENLLQGIP